MPPKAKAPEAKLLSKKALALQEAVDQANSEAQQIYKQHEHLRVKADQIDKGNRENLYLDETVARARLKQERHHFRSLLADMRAAEHLAYATYAKHSEWESISAASRLPDVNNPADINSFLAIWRSRQAAYDTFAPDTTIIASTVSNGTGARKLTFVRGEQRLPPAKRREEVRDELLQCYDAYELAEKIKEAHDVMVGAAASVTSTAAAAAASVSATRSRDPQQRSDALEEVYAQVRTTFDVVAANVLRFYDEIIDSADGETLMRTVTTANPVIKFGMWVKTKDITRSFTSLAFPDLEIRLDPKQITTPKLPKALGLSRENIAVRAVQLAFDPFSCYTKQRAQYYALDCTIKVDLLTFEERPRRNGEWLLRGGTQESHQLHIEEYPPRTAEARAEESALRISFEVPPTIVVRQPSLFIGKWSEETQEWELCSRAMLGASFGNTANIAENPRRATFSTAELAQFAVLHETVFDVLYESWSLKPFDGNRVLISLECHHRGGATDRDFRFLLEDARCRLLQPSDEALSSLRKNWWSPAVLLRKLKQAGFNFLVRDEEAVFLDKVVPKSYALEEKAYADLAQFCQYFTIASSQHNKYGEDPDMALFRVSKKWLRPEEEDESFDIPTAVEVWHSIRYRKDDCALVAFTEADRVADLNLIGGTETHHNLYSLLAPIEGEDELRRQLSNTNYLLRRCVMQFLHLIRPLSWG
jgi:cancer susceptibility candidate protein 1